MMSPLRSFNSTRATFDATLPTTLVTAPSRQASTRSNVLCASWRHPADADDALAPNEMQSPWSLCHAASVQPGPEKTETIGPTRFGSLVADADALSRSPNTTTTR